MGSMDITAQHAMTDTNINSNLHLHTNSFTKWGGKKTIKSMSPLSMVTAIYNASDDGIPEIALVEKSVICV